MDKKYLLLWLEGPLQAWGYNSKFGRRESLHFPTKSGIYGMFLAALGAQGPQKELLRELSQQRQYIISYTMPRGKDTNIYSSGVNNHQSPFLMDFQMVGSGYDEKDPWQKLLIPKKADGSTAVGGGSKMTYRYYLQDAKFAVIQESEAILAEAISKALQNPVFDIYLGRKNCVPTDFVYRGIFGTFNQAIEAANKIKEEKQLEILFAVSEDSGEIGETLVLQDVPIQFGQFKKYRDRTVKMITYE